MVLPSAGSEARTIAWARTYDGHATDSANSRINPNLMLVIARPISSVVNRTLSPSRRRDSISRDDRLCQPRDGPLRVELTRVRRHLLHAPGGMAASGVDCR